MRDLNDHTILIRGAGDLATGVTLRLYRSGFRKLILLETDIPMAVRRTVSLCEAVYDTTQTVEGITAQRISNISECPVIWQKGNIPLLVDPEAAVIPECAPDIVIDAILAKRNLGSSITDAPLVIGLGPGFTAGKDVHCVIETKRGHTLGRVIRQGKPIPNTGVPGVIAGHSLDRVLRGPADGILRTRVDIGTLVTKGDTIGHVETDGNQCPVLASLTGLVRGLLRDGTPVQTGTKLGDIDPRGKDIAYELCSEKSLAIGGGVLEAILAHISGE